MSHNRPSWTVMVFMGADGVEDNQPLLKEAEDDIAEMGRVGSDEHLKIFAQVHQGDAVVPKRYYIQDDAVNGEDVPAKERDLTAGRALRDFIRWSIWQTMLDPITSATPYEDRYSMLVLWGHAYRFGIGPRETRAGIDALDFAELASVLAAYQEEHKTDFKLPFTPKLDIIGFDACDLATIEMTIQMQRFADYMVASQIGVPLPGWPYERILARLKKPQGDRVMGPAEFSSYIVRRYCEDYAAQSRAVSLTALDLKWAPDLFARTELLALRLATAMDRDQDEQEAVYNLFRRARTDDDSPFVDVADLCLELARHSSDPFVRNAATELGDLLVNSPHPPPPGGSAFGARRPFIVEHGRVGAQTANLHGVSLYAPHVADSYSPEQASHWYNKFVFAQKTIWNGLVHALAQPNAFSETALLER